MTRFAHFAIVWAVFIVALGPLLASQFREAGQGRSLGKGVAATGLAMVPFLAWVGVAVSSDMGEQVGPRLLHLAPGMAVLAFLLYRVLALARRPSEAPLLFTLALLTFAGLLVMGPELFRVQDVFGTRMNTVFKLYYQAWIILAVASPVALYYGTRRSSYRLGVTTAEGPRDPSFRPRGLLRDNGVLWRAGRRFAGAAWLALAVAVALGAGYYTVGALYDKAEGFRRSPTLDGLAHLRNGQGGEYDAIRWLWENGREGDGVLEAVGDDYSDYGRVSAATGLPTVLGWAGHERQWRGSFEPLEGRAQDVKALYQGRDVEEARKLLTRYGITYVVVGPRERLSYGEDVPRAIRELLKPKPVFVQDGVTIYQVKDEHGRP